MKKYILPIFLVLMSLGSLFAQEKVKIQQNDYVNTAVPMADQMRADGKIYVVLGIILIILAGLIIYLITIDRKLTRLEKQKK